MRDALVVMCMTVVALAVGIGLHLQFALAFWLALLAAISFYVALLSAHVLLRRSQQVEALRNELSRLEKQIAKAANASPRNATSSLPSEGPALASAPASPATVPPAISASHAASTATAAPATMAVPADYWHFSPVARPALDDQARPSTPHFDNLVWGEAEAAQRAVPAVDAGTGMPASHRDVDADADQINAVIKKIAADITQGQAAMANAAAARETQAPSEIDESIAALQAVADAMRDSGISVDEHPQRHETVTPPPLTNILPVDPARERLAAVAESIERESFDVMLEPILGLGDRRAQHYIVTIRLRSETDQSALEAEARTARGSGLLPLLDAVKVERAARVAWRMEDRGKSGSLFSQLSGESLVSDRFLNRFADTYRQGDTLGSRLVLAFRQAEVRGFSELQWSTVRDMADLGFRFCLEDIVDLDLDFEALAAAGFTFAKLDAAVFFGGLRLSGSTVPAADICRHFQSLRLEVIVGGINDDTVSRTLQSYGVELGQGGLFGGPRAVKSDVLRNPHSAVA